jgi:hypothetical protein
MAWPDAQEEGKAKLMHKHTYINDQTELNVMWSSKVHVQNSCLLAVLCNCQVTAVVDLSKERFLAMYKTTTQSVKDWNSARFFCSTDSKAETWHC